MGSSEAPANLGPASFIWYLVGGDLELHLMLLDETPANRPHFCLAVDDLGKARSRLESAGIVTRDGTELVGRPPFTCRDPFGNLIELARIEA
jgi:catechol 2,3-dioxygenase-like lactoylglutathione lyase family enzyme